MLLILFTVLTTHSTLRVDSRKPERSLIGRALASSLSVYYRLDTLHREHVLIRMPAYHVQDCQVSTCGRMVLGFDKPKLISLASTAEKVFTISYLV